MIDRYMARMNLHGATQRERAKNRLINNLNNKLPNNLSCKDVLLNGVATKLIINTGTQPYYKEFESFPGQEINIGDYVEWANSHWLVTTCDSDDEIYRDGKLEQCNYLLKWQNDFGEIIERWAVIQSASKYNDGTAGNNVLMLGSDQLSVVIPLDSESVRLKKDMSKKFFIDNNKNNPTAYELTGTGNVSDTYNGHGVTSWIVKECAYTATKDDLRFGVCGYKPPHKKRQVVEIQKNETSAISDIKILGKPTLNVSFARTYTAFLADKNGNEVDWFTSGLTWNIVSDFDISTTINGREIELLVDDEDLVGSSFILSLNNKSAAVCQFKIHIVQDF